MSNKLFFFSFGVCVVLVFLASISACSQSDLAEFFGKSGETPENSGNPASPQIPQAPQTPEDSGNLTDPQIPQAPQPSEPPQTPPPSASPYTWYVSSSGNNTNTGTDPSSPLASMPVALTRIKAAYKNGKWPSGMSATIEVKGRIVGGPAVEPYSAMVEVYGAGNYPPIILKGDPVSGGILDANKTTANGRVLYIAKNKVTLGKNLVLTGGRMLWGGAVCIGINDDVFSGGEFIIDGGEISGNSGGSGGAVAVYRGSMRMLSGIITNNNHTNFNNNPADGGAIFINDESTLFMSGGTISNNGKASKTEKGGGIFVNGGTVTMAGGEILNNTAALEGGGVYLTAYSTFNMSGGTISGNKSAKNGGVGASLIDAVFNKTGGTISNNTP
ncbi:MAG: hypothetical protein LBL31_07490 [Spirochaetaceae bacterium]|jgi:hypothetical protein|nr:hypothetical protein [Spirochaetaceae bacterium]